MLERFTRPARQVVETAVTDAVRLRQRYVGSEHLLLALLDGEADGNGDGGVAAAVLREAGLDRPRLVTSIQRVVGAPAPLLSEEDAAALRTIGIDLDAVLGRLEATFGPGALDVPPDDRPAPPRRSASRPRFTDDGKKVLELALREAVRRRDRSIGTEHLLLGLLRDNRSPACRVLADVGADPAALRRRVEERLGAAA